MVYITTEQIAALNGAAEATLADLERDDEYALQIPWKKFRDGTDRDEYLNKRHSAKKAEVKALFTSALKGLGLPRWVGHTLGRVIAADRVVELSWDAFREVSFFGQSDYGRAIEVADDGDWELNWNGLRVRLIAAQAAEPCGGIESLHKGRAW